jgi:hypothetical protein
MLSAFVEPILTHGRSITADNRQVAIVNPLIQTSPRGVGNA